MLEPVNCKFWIDRNLSADWYHGTPDMVIKGTIRAATVRIQIKMLAEHETIFLCVQNFSYLCYRWEWAMKTMTSC